MPDNRKHPRRDLHPPVAWQAGDGPLVEGTCHDISLGGMFVESAPPARFGATITIHLRLPTAPREMTIQAVVRWTKPTGMGVQFGVMGARETHALTEYLAGAE